jgi:hypothetical protein
MSATTTYSPIAGSSWVQRAINVSITLGEGTFGDTGSNTVKLMGLRVVASINKGGFPSMDKADVRIYGLTPSVMNELSQLGVPFTLVRRNNILVVEAGDATNGMAVVFTGYLNKCWQNFDGMPDTFLQIESWIGVLQAGIPTTPLSFSGAADVATIMSGLAVQQGLSFENNGVQVKLSNPYLPGTPLEQMHKLARDADINMYLDIPPAIQSSNTTRTFGTLAIWPKNGTRGGTVPVINVNTGMIGYPKFNDTLIQFRTLLNPNLKIGGKILLQSSLGGTPAPPGNTSAAVARAGGPNGYWYIQAPFSYDLAAQVPDGPWYCDVTATRLNISTP